VKRNQAIIISLVVALIWSLATVAEPPAEYEQFIGSWINAKTEDAKIDSLKVTEWNMEIEFIPHTTATGPATVTMAGSVSFYSESQNGASAVRMYWRENGGKHNAIAWLQGNQLVLEIFIRVQGATDYFIREFFIRQTETEDAG